MVILGSMLRGIGTGKMISAKVMVVCVCFHPAVVRKLPDRGSAQSHDLVTGAFLSVPAERLGVAGKV